MKGFLYGKTEYDLLNNSCHLDDILSYAKENGFTYISITDPNLYGHKKFYDKALSLGIKPIIGMELKCKNDVFIDTLLLYPINNLGYQELLEITAIYNDSNEFKLEELSKYKNIYYILNFNKSILGDALKVNNNSEVSFELERYQNLLSNFYIGISYQNQNMISFNNNIVAYASNFGIKCVYIHETKYLNDYDRITYEALCKIGNHSIEVGRYALSDYNIELIDSNILLNTNELVESINYDLFKKVSLPKYKFSKLNTRDYLASMSHVGLKKRLSNNKYMNNNLYNIYFNRLNYELSIIDKMNFNDYFLIVWDFIRYAKSHNILVGPGRGSAAGSLVAYSLGIIEVDPIKHNLLFERFLNPERISMPDIDTDIPDDKRDELLLYVRERYGSHSVSSIITFGTYTRKTAFRDLIKLFKIDNNISKELEKLILSNKDFDEILRLVDDNDTLKDFVYIISRLENMPKNTSTHAAGIIIYDDDLSKVIPLQKGLLGLYQSQLDASDLESIGLLKIDFLGIKNLSIIDNVLKEIKKEHSYLREIPFNDPKVFEMLSKADTLGIFQLESQGVRNVLIKLKPNEFNDLVAVLALYRPGPMDNIDTYIERKYGKKFTYIDKSLEPILKETYGIIIYQEQIMQISQVICGYSLGEADVLRRAISKKKAEIIEDLRQDFIVRGIKNGYTKEVVNNIYDYIVKFASYGFNKSHSVAYATLAYYMLYLKAHYFNEFMANLMNNSIGSVDTLKEYNGYLRKHGIKIVNPDINVSKDIYVPYKNQLFMPLNSIRDVGVIATREILDERNKGLFKDFNDFVLRTNFLDVDVYKALIFSGSLDRYKKARKNMYDSLCNKGNDIDKYFPDRTISDVEFSYKELEDSEKYYLGINIRYNPFNQVINLRNNGIDLLVNLSNYSKVFVKFRNIKHKVSKKGKAFVTATCYDDTYEYEMIVFDNNLFAKINEDNIFLVELNKRNDDNRDSIILNNIIKIL